MRNKTTRKLVESGLFIAIATVLSFLKIDLPFGGGVTIVSMLPLLLVSHRWGWKWGVFTAFVYGVLQMLIGLDNVGYASSPLAAVGIILFDYVVAYAVIGLSGIFDSVFGKTRQSVCVGTAVTFVLRFVCHFITGVWIWGGFMPESFMNMTMTSPYVYSFLYNGWYMLAELVLTEVVINLIYAPLGRYFRREDIR